MAITLATGEALTGDGNELAHIDLLIGSKSGPVGAAFASAFTTETEGHTNLLAVVTPNLAAKPDTRDHQQGDDQGREAGRAAVRPRSGRGRPRGRRLGRRGRHPQGPGRRPVPHRRRLHPLGRRRRQEDLRLQLRGREAGDRARARRRAEHRQGARRHAGRAPPVRRRRRGLESPAGQATDRASLDRAGRRAAARRPAHGRHRRQLGDRERRSPSRSPAPAPASASATGARQRPRGRWRPSSAPGHPLLRADLEHRRRLRRRSSQRRSPRSVNVDVWVNNAGADVLTGEAGRWPAERKLAGAARARPEGDDPLLAAGRRPRLRPRRLHPQHGLGSRHRRRDGGRRRAELHAAVKAGVLGFSKSFARSVAPDVRVNVLCPGWIETAFGAGADRDVPCRDRGADAAAALGPTGRTSPAPPSGWPRRPPRSSPARRSTSTAARLADTAVRHRPPGRAGAARRSSPSSGSTTRSR